MLLTTPSEMTQESIGYANLCTSTGSFVDSHLRGRNTGVYVERDTGTTRHGLLAGQPGRETTPSLSAATADLFGTLLGTFFCLLLSGFLDISF